MTHYPPPRHPEKELLDHLPLENPAARASRADLKRINAFMGNFRFVLRSLRRVARPGDRLLELGAGDGSLGGQCQRTLPEIDYTGLDTAPAPAPAPGIHWRQTSALEFDDYGSFDILVANLLLHHFENDALEDLGRRLGDRIRCLILVEPWRHPLPGTLMRAAHPLVHPVTRHDSAASIRAGFRPGELPRLLQLHSPVWNAREKTVWRGGLRVLALRNS